jgi:hypothetical protein
MPKRSNRSKRSSKSLTSSLTSATDTRIVRAALARNPSSDTSMITRIQTQVGSLSSTVGGNIASVIPLRPDQFSDWSNISPLYDEFRFVGAKIQFFCQQQNSLTVQSQPIVCVYDNDDNTTALAAGVGLTAGLDYRKKVQFASVWDNQNFPSLTATAYSSADPVSGRIWSTVATPNALPCSFKMISTGLTVSTSYLTYTIQAVFQYRGAI